MRTCCKLLQEAPTRSKPTLNFPVAWPRRIAVRGFLKGQELCFCVLKERPVRPPAVDRQLPALICYLFVDCWQLSPIYQRQTVNCRHRRVKR